MERKHCRNCGSGETWQPRRYPWAVCRCCWEAIEPESLTGPFVAWFRRIIWSQRVCH